LILAIYPIINKETGEKKIIQMSVHDIQQWYEDNKPWVRDWSEGCASPGEVGDWKNRLTNKHPGWGEILKKADKSGGSKSKMQY
jgi:hypothetical protein